MCSVWAVVATNAAAWAEVKPVPDVVKPAVADKQVPAALDQVKLEGFLGSRITANEQARLLTLDENQLLDPFRKRPGPQEWAGEHVGKWLHAATLAWVNTGDPKLREKLDRVAAELMKTQLPDGYLGTYLPKDYWTAWDVWVHKYDLMGLLTYYRYTGDQPALESCKKIGDLLCATFGKDQRDIIKAGEHVGMAATSVLEPMVLLYRATGDKKYFEFCTYILWAWDQPHGPKVLSTLAAGKGVNQVANGKAYEMLSNLVGLCELYRTTGEQEFLQPVLSAWEDIVKYRLYVTGSASQGEHFRDDYFLPNDAKPHIMETCVTVTWMQLNAQLLRLTGEARFADQLERTAYNHLAGAQLPSGGKWCYYTPLEGAKPYDAQIHCCASSGPRGIGLIPSAAYAANARGVVVNFYERGSARLRLAGGAEVRIRQETNFPTDGKIVVRIGSDSREPFTVSLRIPPWCRSYRFNGRELHAAGSASSVGSNGLSIDTEDEAKWRVEWVGEYAQAEQVWGADGKIELELGMPVRGIDGQHGNAGKMALTYGPFVLSADEGSNAERKPVAAVSIAPTIDPAVLKIAPATAIAELFSILVPAYTGDGGRTPTTLKMVPFAMAGADGSACQVWFTKAGSGSGK